MSNDSYSAVVVTFRRPDSLRVVLARLLEQTHPPAIVVVSDNDPDESARPVVEEFAGDTAASQVIYLPVGRNLGPAGGWAAAVADTQQRSDRGSWVGVFDDDDPLDDPDLMRILVGRAASAVADDSRLAAVGLRGARLARARLRLHRVDAASGVLEPVDYLAGNGAPVYRWDAIEDVGFFDPALFFGFEDLDLGLRLGAAGWGLMTLGSPLQIVADTAADRVPWREYYKTRALVVIARRHVGWIGTASLLARSVVGGSVLLLVRQRSSAALKARFAGAVDGLRGRLGIRRYFPSSNPSKVRTD